MLDDGKNNATHEAKDADKSQWGNLVETAMHAERVEKEMTLWEGLKMYRRAVGWSLAVSLTLIMEGYDTSLLSNATGLPQFRKKFGFYAGEKKGYQLTAAWQTVLGLGGSFGSIIGIFIASWCQDRFGYRRTIQGCLVLISGFIAVVTFAPNVEVLFVGELLCGLPWGAFSSSAVAYASEVTPVALRGYLTTYVNLCWIMGQLIASGIVVATQKRTDSWAYQLPFAIQWVWPIPLFILVQLAPESPWYLVRKGRVEEAESSVARLACPTEDLSAADTVAMMVRTNAIEKEKHEETSYWECLRGPNLRRTEIACMAWAATVLAGSAFANHPTYFFQQAGLSTKASFQMNLGMRGLAFVGTLLSWVTMTFLGRRPMFIFGLSLNAICLLLIAILSFPGNTHVGPRWGESALCMVWVFVWDSSVTVTAYAIVGEVSSTRLRAKSVGLARMAYNATSLVCGVLNTYMINATAWNWAGRAGFFWFGSCLLTLIWAIFRLPESKGRTFRELDVLFSRKTPAWRFSKAEVEETDVS